MYYITILSVISIVHVTVTDSAWTSKILPRKEPNCACAKWEQITSLITWNTQQLDNQENMYDVTNSCDYAIKTVKFRCKSRNRKSNNSCRRGQIKVIRKFYLPRGDCDATIGKTSCGECKNGFNNVYTLCYYRESRNYCKVDTVDCADQSCRTARHFRWKYELENEDCNKTKCTNGVDIGVRKYYRICVKANKHDVINGMDDVIEVDRLLCTSDDSDDEYVTKCDELPPCVRHNGPVTSQKKARVKLHHINPHTRNPAFTITKHESIDEHPTTTEQYTTAAQEAATTYTQTTSQHNEFDVTTGYTYNKYDVINRYKINSEDITKGHILKNYDVTKEYATNKYVVTMGSRLLPEKVTKAQLDNIEETENFMRDVTTTTEKAIPSTQDVTDDIQKPGLSWDTFVFVMSLIGFIFLMIIVCLLAVVCYVCVCRIKQKKNKVKNVIVTTQEQAKNSSRRPSRQISQDNETTTIPSPPPANEDVTYWIVSDVNATSWPIDDVMNPNPPLRMETFSPAESPQSNDDNNDVTSSTTNGDETIEGTVTSDMAHYDALSRDSFFHLGYPPPPPSDTIESHDVTKDRVRNGDVTTEGASDDDVTNDIFDNIINDLSNLRRDLSCLTTTCNKITLTGTCNQVTPTLTDNCLVTQSQITPILSTFEPRNKNFGLFRASDDFYPGKIVIDTRKTKSENFHSKFQHTQDIWKNKEKLLKQKNNCKRRSCVTTSGMTSSGVTCSARINRPINSSLYLQSSEQQTSPLITQARKTSVKNDSACDKRASKCRQNLLGSSSNDSHIYERPLVSKAEPVYAKITKYCKT